jgi:hypothetical protein
LAKNTVNQPPLFCGLIYMITTSRAAEDFQLRNPISTMSKVERGSCLDIDTIKLYDAMTTNNTQQ